MSILAPLGLYVFTALVANPANSIDTSQMRQAHSMVECEKWRGEFNTSMKWINKGMAPAFKLRWSTSCKLHVLNEGDDGV